MATTARSPVRSTANAGAVEPSGGSPRVPEEKLVDRPRLASLFEHAAQARLIVLQAPAGYGKTSVMQQWANRCRALDKAVVWLSLNQRDRDPMFFARHLEKLLEGTGVPERAGITGQFEQYVGWQALLENIGGRFFSHRGECWVFLDDAQTLAGSESAEGLQGLVEGASSNLHFVIGTRGETGLPMGRLRAHHEVIELSTADLRFDDTETLTYLRNKEGLDVDRQHADLLQDRADGWIVGIKLFSMAVALDPENRHILENLTGERKQIAEFFLEDVLSRLSADLQDFLLRISLLEEFCPALCDEVLQIENSRALIDRCEASGLFLQERDVTRTWYRFHHLFAEFLRRQLQDRMPREASEIYRRGAGWLSRNSCHVAAFDCAMKAQDHMFAARALDEQCEQMFATGLQPTVQEMAARLPQHIIALFPRLMLTLAWRLAAQWRLSEARSLVAVAQQRLADITSAGGEGADLEWLRLTFDHRNTMIAHAAYQLDELESRSSKAIQASDMYDKGPYLMGSFHNSLQFAQREQFKLEKVERLDQEARALVGRTGARNGEIFIAAVTGGSLILMGQTQRAKTLLGDSLALARRIAGRDAPLGAVVATTLAMLHYECNELEEAEALLEQYRPVMTSAGFVDQLVFGWLTQARLHLARGDADGCQQTLDEASSFGSRFELDQLRIHANVEQLRVLLKLGRPDDAARFARRRGLVTDQTTSGRIPSKYTVLDSAIAMANCRLLAADDRFADALALARRWRSFVGATKAIQAAVEWDILLAQLLLLSGEGLAAQRTLIRALGHAAPARFIRRFLDEGEPVSTLLVQMAQRDGPEVAEHKFLQEIVGFLDPGEKEKDGEEDLDDDAGMILGRITSREREILGMAGDGMLNRQIGEQLGLTEGTVKWYLQQVYDKIGVRSRKQAFQRARRLGLIK
jgi:LuxR family maltose regulon positive regulatory protein